MTILRLNTKSLSVYIYVPTETSENEVKDEFYNKLDEVYKSFPSNVIKLVLGDLNVKRGRESHYAQMIK